MIPRLLMTCLFLLLIPGLARADSFSCPGGIVSSGDRSVAAIVKCGQPTEKNSHLEEIIDRSDPDLKRKTRITVEEWTWDLGPDMLTRTMVIRNGVISEIRTGPYGSKKTPEAAPDGCADLAISPGETRTNVLLKCGEPFNKDVRYEETSERLDAARTLRTTVLVETWTYNYGPNRFMRIITMKNGTVTDVQTGGYGMKKERN